jgi:hypothetical protein
MGSINWVGKCASGVLSLSFSGGAALAQDNVRVVDRVSIDARAKDPIQDGVRAFISGGGQLRRNARSSMLDWGTGGFELRGERLRSGSRLIDNVRLGSQWQRTYAADVSFWESATPDIVFEAGARLERTSRGVAVGPLLTSPTKTVAQMAYVGVQISASASIRLIAFDNGGWSEGATEQLVSRIVNGEPAAGKGAALEIGKSGFRPATVRWDPEFKLRAERGRTGTRSATSATISWEVRF